MSILQKWIGQLFKISLQVVGINTHLLPVVHFSLTLPQQVKLSPLYGRRGQNRTHFAPKDSFYVIFLCAVEHFRQNGQLRSKVRQVEVHCGYKECYHQCSCGTFQHHNAQTCWLRGLSGTYIFADENGSVPQLESFSVYELDVSWVSEITNAIQNPPMKKALTQSSCRQLTD